MNDCFELGESGIAWRMGQAAKGGAVPSMYFNWASYHEETNGLRPKDPVGHDAVDGISSSYQYYMERDCHVLMRKYSCWCPACRRVARRTVGALSAGFKVSGCERTGRFYEWTNKTCGPKSGSDGASAVNKRTQERGHELFYSGWRSRRWQLGPGRVLQRQGGRHEAGEGGALGGARVELRIGQLRERAKHNQYSARMACSAALPGVWNRPSRSLAVRGAPCVPSARRR